MLNKPNRRDRASHQAIRTEAEYDRALFEAARYFEHEPHRGTPEADRFDILAA